MDGGSHDVVQWKMVLTRIEAASPHVVPFAAGDFSRMPTSCAI